MRDRNCDAEYFRENFYFEYRFHWRTKNVLWLRVLLAICKKEPPVKKKRLSTFDNTLVHIKSRHIQRHACTSVALNMNELYMWMYTKFCGILILYYTATILLIRKFKVRMPRHIISGTCCLTNGGLFSVKDIFAFELLRMKISRFQYPSLASRFSSALIRVEEK